METRYITIAAAAAQFPSRNGKKVNVSSVRRWIAAGVRGVRLKAELVGGSWMTTPEWLSEFVTACTRKALGSESVIATQRNDDHVQAMKALKARWGIDVQAK